MNSDPVDYFSPLRSELKLKILLSLLEADKKISELKTTVETRDTTILHILEEFDDLNLTTKKQGTYSLTPIGYIEAKIFKEYISTTETLEKFKDFWLTHNINDIPTHLLSNLGALANSKLVRTQAAELGIVHKTFMDTIKKSKAIRGISPIFHQDFIGLFGDLLDQGCKIELVVSSDVLNKITQFVDISSVAKYLESKALRIYLNDDVKVALALTDTSLSLGLFSLSGIYDDSLDLVSNEERAHQWGSLLFEDVVRKSRKINF
jgi:predicted transcriptional regulator